MRNGNKPWTLISLAINPVSVLHPAAHNRPEEKNLDQWFPESSSEQQHQCPTSGLKKYRSSNPSPFFSLLGQEFWGNLPGSPDSENQ